MFELLVNDVLMFRTANCIDCWQYLADHYADSQWIPIPVGCRSDSVVRMIDGQRTIEIRKTDD